MDDSATLIWGLLFGSVGIGYFVYGRRQARLVFRYTGIALMLFPYFVDNTPALLAVGVVLLLTPRFIDL